MYWIEGDFSQEDIGEIIKDIRVSFLNKRIPNVSKEIEIDEAVLRDAEKGKSNSSPAILKKICDVYGLKTTIKIEEQTKTE